jgi:hypothetical protein
MFESNTFFYQSDSEWTKRAKLADSFPAAEENRKIFNALYETVIQCYILLYFSTIYFRYTLYEHKQVNHSSRSIVVCLFTTTECDL